MGDYFVASLETIIKTALKATDHSRFMSIMYNRLSWKMEEEDIYIRKMPLMKDAQNH